MTRFFTALAIVCAAATAGCGGTGDSNPATSAAIESTPTGAPAEPEGQAQPQAPPELAEVKKYLVELTDRLKIAVGQLERDAQTYFNLLEELEWDYAELLREHREETAGAVKHLQSAYLQATPDYEEMEGLVAGVPSLAEFHAVFDAGAKPATPVTITTPREKTYELPRDLFTALETTAFGTDRRFQAKGVKADLDGDGKVAFPEAIPDADFVLGLAKAFVKHTELLAQAAQAWEPTVEDALAALATKIRTVPGYFKDWKASRYVTGGGRQKRHSARSRLADVRDLLTGLNVVYDGIHPAIEGADADLAPQLRGELQELHDYASRMLSDEEGGMRYTAADADELLEEAQGAAEAIADKLAQAARLLGASLER
jgi:hypothetical protein